MSLFNIKESSLFCVVLRLYGPCLYTFVELFLRGIDLSYGPHIHRATQTQKNFRRMSLLRVEVEPTIPVSDL